MRCVLGITGYIARFCAEYVQRNDTDAILVIGASLNLIGMPHGGRQTGIRDEMCVRY